MGSPPWPWDSGREVVEGGKSLTFCPRYPQKLIQFSSVEDILANSQTEFWALELDHAAGHRHKASDLREVRYGLARGGGRWNSAAACLHLFASTIMPSTTESAGPARA